MGPREIIEGLISDLDSGGIIKHLEAAVEYLSNPSRGLETAHPPLWKECPECSDYGGYPPCPTCEGQGYINHGLYGSGNVDECVECEGTGNIPHGCPSCQGEGRIWIYYTPAAYIKWYEENRPESVPTLYGDTHVYILDTFDGKAWEWREGKLRHNPANDCILSIPAQPKPNPNYRHEERE